MDICIYDKPFILKINRPTVKLTYIRNNDCKIKRKGIDGEDNSKVSACKPVQSIHDDMMVNCVNTIDNVEPAAERDPTKITGQVSLRRPSSRSGNTCSNIGTNCTVCES